MSIPPVNLSLPLKEATKLPLEEMDNSNRHIGAGVFPLAAISERPGHNPRKDYGEHDGSFASLVESIKQFGMIQPPVIIPASTAQDAWFVVSGHRRIAAARAAGLGEVRCIELGWDWTTDDSGKDLARETLASYTETEQSIYALIENLQRKELNCIEVAEGVHQLERLGKTQEEIGRWIGRSQGAVSKLSRLLTLPDGVRAYLRTGELSQSHGEELLPLLCGSFLTGEIESLASRAVEQGLTANGLRHVVREKIERATPKQETLEEVASGAGEYSAPNSDAFDEDRIARTLASTTKVGTFAKGLDRDPTPQPKDTNGLTRKESDKEFAAAMAPDEDIVPLSSLPNPTDTPLLPVKPVDTANMLEVEPRYLKMLADISLTPEYLSYRIGEILGDIIERRACELGVLPLGRASQLPLEPVAPITADVFPVFEVPVKQPERQSLPPVVFLEAGEDNCNYWEFARGYSGVSENKIHKSIWIWTDPAGVERGFTTPLGSINRTDTTSAWFLMLEVIPVEEYGQEPLRDYTSGDYHALIGNHSPTPENLRGIALYKGSRRYVLTGEAMQVEFNFNGGRPTKRQVEHEARAAQKAETDVAFCVGYCYPQRGEWQGGGECEVEDGDPASFKSLVDARKFAAEESARNPRFLVHVTIWTTGHLEGQYDRCQQRGDLWFFRGQPVPGGVSNSIPSEESLAVVGCVLSDLYQLEGDPEEDRSEGSGLGLFGEARTTTDLVDDMAGRLV